MDWHINTGGVSKMKAGENIFVMMKINILFEPKISAGRKNTALKLEKDCSKAVHPYKKQY